MQRWATALLMTVVACTPSAPLEPAVELDAAGQRACREFAEVADDVQTRTLLGAERNAALQDVFDEAMGSEVPGLAEAARRVLSAAINDDQDALRDALPALRAICGVPL